MGSPNSSEAMDRISALPDEIIHHILGFVPAIESVRLSLLSRRWRHMWRSNPTLNLFHDRSAQDESFAKEFLKRRLEDLQRVDSDSAVTSLTIRHQSLAGLADPLTSFLSSPKIINNIEKLDVSAHDWHHVPFELLNSRSLTLLLLQRVKLDALNRSADLPSLRHVRLANVSMCDGVLGHLLSSCPSLDTLNLICCSGLKTPKILSFSLKSFGYYSQEDCKTVLIEAVNLQSLELSLGKVLFDISACKAIRNIELWGCEVDDKLWRDIEHKFALLECLKLTLCTTTTTLEEIIICSQSLKKFIVHKSGSVQWALTFETPNLVAFEYQGDFKFSMWMNSSNDQLNGSITIWPGTNENFYSGLIKFASGFNWPSNNKLSLDFQSYELNFSAILFMKDSLGRPMWPKREHMEVNRYEIREGTTKLESSMECFSPLPLRNSSVGTPVLQAIQLILRDHHERYLSAQQNGELPIVAVISRRET